MSESDRLRRLAARLARDRPVDWDEQERDASTDEERDAIRQLRVVAAMAGFHRSLQAGDASSDLSSSVSIARGVADPGHTTPLPPSEPELPAGSRWGHLEVRERVGRGAFGEVYRARDPRLDRIVALKILLLDTPASPDEVVREARLLAKVRHANVATVYGADRIDGRVGIWMEFLQGETLDRILRARGALSAREAALVGIDLCQALSAVHAAGIIHQDIKLGNIMRAEGGRIVLMDFGLGREARTHRPAGKTRKISGTPLYMAPEVLRGTTADARSDVYSLGVVLFALVTGVMPVESASFSDLLAKHERGEVRRARDRRPDLPEAFAAVLDRALMPDPGQRFATPGEFERALLQSLGATVESQPARRRSGWAPPWAIAGLGGALVIATIFGVRAARQPHALSEVPATAPIADLPNLTLLGEATNDLFGLAVAGLGDIDHDGFDDVVIGAPQHDGGGDDRGKIYLYRGTPQGLETHPSWTAVGIEDNDLLGWSFASFTNLHMDGLADLVVGASGSEGRVLIYHGSKDGLSTQPNQTLAPDVPGMDFGYSISTGDVNHDGLDDLLVGEPAFRDGTTKIGRAHLYLANGTTLSSEPTWTATGPRGSSFGVSVSLGGDINHDGYTDAVIGAHLASFGPELSEGGAAYVFLGSATGLDSIPTVIPGRQAGANLGIQACIVGDLDADGFSDVMLGAEYGSNGERAEGIVEIYFGSKSGIFPFNQLFLESNAMGANFGAHGGGAGDLDGDGCDDLFVGAMRYQRTEPREGAAFLYNGSRDRRIARSWLRVRGRTGAWHGAAGGSAGDVNGDGFPDFIVSSPSWDTEIGINVGQVEVFHNTRKR